MRTSLYIFLTLFFLSCSEHEPEKTAEHHEEAEDIITLTEAQIKNANIETETIKTHVMSRELKVNGLVDVPPQNIVSVSFPLGGYLKSTNLLPGMHINKGEIIATMQDQSLIQLQQDYLVAKAKLQYLEKDFERQKMLNENKVNADKIFQQAQADFAAQKVQARGYEEKLRLVGINPDKLSDQTLSRNVHIYSPIDGFVSKVNVNIGKYVNPSDVLFELINPDDIHAALTVFEKDISKIKPKQKVMVTFVDDPSTQYECEVILVTRNVDNDRSALVHCHFEKKPKQLLPGMFLNAVVNLEDIKTTAVPENAVVRYNKQSFIIVETGDTTYRLIPVETGNTSSGLVELVDKSNDLQGKKIITQNAYAVLSKLKNAQGGDDH
ncbi:efflux transporter periplasmic adaptor subunit [Terrimonas sp.]|uniref:efflux RND transporter periplasmic adaptor subunit n=1 Tax=Terrimonas sp. TaxID=1914338 RepID=UPI000D51EE6E|nr:efflux RND transporter periplasmic adaptor subunit [Terrimonas sp.]PVD52322.1 efflux transporter periplasmic adaptor subunit [Terrimonas sp.]